MTVLVMLPDSGQTRPVSAVLQRVDAQGVTYWQASTQTFVAGAAFHAATDAVQGFRGDAAVPAAADYVNFVVPGAPAVAPGAFYVLIPTTPGLPPVGVAPYEYPPSGFGVVA